MTRRLQNVSTETWHRIIEDLEAEGFRETYRYEGMDAGIDYSRFDLVSRAGDETVVFEWDNWAEGEIRGPEPRLAALREKYRLSDLAEEGG